LGRGQSSSGRLMRLDSQPSGKSGERDMRRRGTGAVALVDSSNHEASKIRRIRGSSLLYLNKGSHSHAGLLSDVILTT
jgi:hypothetical protein